MEFIIAFLRHAKTTIGTCSFYVTTVTRALPSSEIFYNLTIFLVATLSCGGGEYQIYWGATELASRAKFIPGKNNCVQLSQ